MLNCKETSCHLPPQQPECPRLGAEGVSTWGLGYYFIKEAGGVPTCGRSSGNGEISKGEASPKVKSCCFVVHLPPCPHRELPPWPAFEDRMLFLTHSLKKALSSILRDQLVFISP